MSPKFKMISYDHYLSDSSTTRLCFHLLIDHVAIAMTVPPPLIFLKSALIPIHHPARVVYLKPLLVISLQYVVTPRHTPQPLCPGECSARSPSIQWGLLLDGVPSAQRSAAGAEFCAFNLLFRHDRRRPKDHTLKGGAGG
jgi:hypothetical protein